MSWRNMTIKIRKNIAFWLVRDEVRDVYHLHGETRKNALILIFGSGKRMSRKLNKMVGR